MSTLVTLSFILLSPATATSSAHVAAIFTAESPINAIEASVALPEGSKVLEGGSAVSYWIEKPRYDETTHVAHFAGVIPGGTTGGTLVEFEVPSGTTLIYRDGHAYLDSPDAIEAPVRLLSLDTSPLAGGALVWVLVLVVALGVFWLMARHLRLRVV